MFSQPKATPDICAKLFLCRLHVYLIPARSSLHRRPGGPWTCRRDRKSLVCRLTKMGWSESAWSSTGILRSGSAAEEHSLARNLVTIQPQATYCMRTRRTYRRVTEDQFTAHHIDCGMYLFLMVVCLRADESLVMQLPELEHRARRVLPGTPILHLNPIVIDTG